MALTGSAIHGAIYQLGNRIAFLEADPEIDDGYKGAHHHRGPARHIAAARHASPGAMALGHSVLL